MSTVSKQNNLLSSPYPIRKKKKNNVKLSWNKNCTLGNTDAEQIDAFVADIIAKASEDYLKECRDCKAEEETWPYPDDNLPGMMENDRLLQLSSEAGCGEIDHFKENTSMNHNASILHSNSNDSRRQRHRNLRMTFRRILLQFACCHCDCFKNMYELT